MVAIPRNNFSSIKYCFTPHPFGMIMPERVFESGNYRCGFNGKEKENELADVGNLYSFELRIYDARLSRYSSIDPRCKEYPWQSTYAYFKNSPISQIDFLGGGDDPKGEKPNGSITYSSDALKKKVEIFLSPTIEKPRTSIGKIFHKTKTKTVTNTLYQPKIAETFQNLIDGGANVLITDNANDFDASMDATKVPGGSRKTGTNSYLIYFNSKFDETETGTSPLFEEVFHVYDYYTGDAKLVFDPNSKVYKYSSNDAQLDEEARAKYKVITEIKNIHLTFYSTDPSYPTNTYAYMNTSFGYMIINKMNEKEIRVFISENAGRLYKWPAYWRNSGVDQLLKDPAEKNILMEGAYQHLKQK